MKLSRRARIPLTLAMVLGLAVKPGGHSGRPSRTCLAFAVQRYRFFGRDVVSLLVILPIALPGIVTGIAPNSATPPGATYQLSPIRAADPTSVESAS